MSWKNYSTLVLQCCWRQKTGKVAFCFLVHGLATFVFVSSSLCIISLWASSVDMVSILVSAGQERNNGLVQLLTKLWQRNFPDWLMLQSSRQNADMMKNSTFCSTKIPPKSTHSLQQTEELQVPHVKCELAPPLFSTRRAGWNLFWIWWNLEKWPRDQHQPFGLDSGKWPRYDRASPPCIPE